MQGNRYSDNTEKKEKEYYIRIKESDFIEIFCQVHNLFNNRRSLTEMFKSDDTVIGTRYRGILANLTKTLNSQLSQEIFTPTHNPFEIKCDYVGQIVEKHRKTMYD